MTELTPLPPSIESLTPEWLTAALRNGGALPEGSVTSFGHEIIGEGIGFIGTVARLKLQYSGAGPEAPATAIAKLPSEDPGSRMVGVAFGLYEREVRFYSDLAGDCGLPAPKPYFSHYDAGAGQAAIILEDLTGGAFGDQVAGASLAEAELAIDAIGAFHARWWESPEFARYPWITSGIETIRQPIQLMYAAAWPVAMERFGYVFPEELRPLIPDFGRRTMAALDQMTLGPETLVHGDYRPDNLFFGAPGGARPLVACDWQSPGKATGVVDAAYFITGSMEPADRRKHEDDLLRRYHNQLLEGGVKDYSFDQLKTDFRGYFAGVIAGGVVLLGTLPEGNDRGRRLIESSMNRFISAMQDHDSWPCCPSSHGPPILRFHTAPRPASAIVAI
ncbi:phosphotransferase [Candidatus Amarobacter glycogenicus]|uniref:phosphotransferase n=1 Tax=Candidatus Amarobacter glycogenicus TaxID=3140699 RepID=UPI003134DDBA|nr:phosphotransferase [Dehalococcoidia bacterium]